MVQHQFGLWKNFPNVSSTGAKYASLWFDERWVPLDDAASNAALVRRHLLQNEAEQAYFLPLKNSAPNPVDGFMECENSLHELMVRLDFAVLGMGNDGHTASWFPGSEALPKCLDEGNGKSMLPFNSLGVQR